MLHPKLARIDRRGVHRTSYTRVGNSQETWCAIEDLDGIGRAESVCPSMPWENRAESMDLLQWGKDSCLTCGPCDHPDSVCHNQPRLNHFFLLVCVGSRRGYCYRPEKLGFAIGNCHHSRRYSKKDGQPRCPARGCPVEERRREAYP